MNVLANPIFYLQHHLGREDLAKPGPCSRMPVGHLHPGGAVPLVRQDLSSPACARPLSLLTAEPGAPGSLPLYWHFFLIIEEQSSVSMSLSKSCLAQSRWLLFWPRGGVVSFLYLQMGCGEAAPF